MPRTSITPDDGNTNGWYNILPAPPPARRVQGQMSCDWAVVGAGVTGLAAARRIAENCPNDKVFLIEGQRVGRGVSGRNSGFVLGVWFHGELKDEQIPQVRALQRLNESGRAQLRRLVQENQIACQWSDWGQLYVSAGEVGDRRLEDYQRGMEKLKEDHRVLTRQEVSKATGSDFYRWAIHTPGTALMNPAAMAALGTSEGGVTTIVLNGLQIPVFVRGAVNLFPTLDAARGFVVLNDEQLQSIAGSVGAVEMRRPNELWLRFDESASIEARRSTLRALTAVDAPLRVKTDALIQAAMLDDTNADPTLQAAGSGILTVAFIAVLGLSTLGVVVTLVLGARARAVEFAVLRAVGASGRQILRGLLLEWGMVLVVGATVGLALGRAVASLMLRFLEVTERGERVLPPFIVQTDWRAIGLGVGLLAAVVLVTLLVSWSVAMARSAAAQLRLTE